MNRGFAYYRLFGYRFVQGWLHGEVLTMLSAVDAVQRENNVTGSIAEIGVHHGKLFIALQLLQTAAEKSVAIDVFGDQHLNVDQSGKGDYGKFLNNVERWASGSGVVVHQGDSTQLHPEKLLELAGSPIRLFSVDGGHTEQIVMSDMRLAEATLADGGVVIADDVFNAEWPDVAVGTLRYLQEGGALAPFIIGFNKVLFASPQHCDKYRYAVEAAFSKHKLTLVKQKMYAGFDVGMLLRVPRTPRHLLGRSKIARSVYHRVVRAD
jgi:hypothetical protein